MKKQARPYPNRIREIREAKDPKMTLEKFAELTDLSVGYLSKLEAGKQPLNARIMPKIAGALGVRPSELIDSATAWLEIDIAGIISDNHEIKPVSANGTSNQRLTAKVPAALGESQAALVVGNSLFPRYDDGDVIIYLLQEYDSDEDLIGKECVVTLKDGRTFIKTVIRGSDNNHYHLTSFGAPPVYDAQITHISPIRWVGRA